MYNRQNVSIRRSSDWNSKLDDTRKEIAIALNAFYTQVDVKISGLETDTNLKFSDTNKKFSDINRKFSEMDSRNLSRLRNFHLIDLNANLVQIPNENGEVPQRFPQTANHIRDMSDTDIDFLLISYGLPKHENTRENRHMLGKYIGVQHI
ncbi:hypothetical protein RhiirA4_452100 [Rhizophagus irregularis]|uniref:Uncharacterized protein n=1 Tax=Rhizophagus irregularis TaxID=588596 RepID=A0A2I1FXC7_9GLOM|nr:hypothetical protein RhiirA4_452100 [Rhizophagus irregularis]